MGVVEERDIIKWNKVRNYINVFAFPPLTTENACCLFHLHVMKRVLCQFSLYLYFLTFLRKLKLAEKTTFFLLHTTRTWYIILCTIVLKRWMSDQDRSRMTANNVLGYNYISHTSGYTGIWWTWIFSSTKLNSACLASMVVEKACACFYTYFMLTWWLKSLDPGKANIISRSRSILII